MFRPEIFALMMLLFVASCASTGKLEPYRANSQQSVLHPQFSGLWNPSAGGTVKLSMPDGEVLNGTYSFMQRGKAGFGKLYGRSFVVGGAADPRTEYPGAGGFGEIVMQGDRGTSMQCEFFYDAKRVVGGTYVGSNSGHGVCETSTKQSYLLTM